MASTPKRNTFAASKTIVLASDSKVMLKKQITSVDLRDAQKIDDDILNTAFASSPVLSKIQKFQQKSKSTSTINTPSSVQKSALPAVIPRTSVFKSTPISASRSAAKRLFFNSTGGIGEGVPRTPECHPRSLVFSQTPRSQSKGIEDDSKSRENGEISNLTVAIRVRPMNVKECTTPSVANVISIEENEVTVLAGISADSSAGLSHTFYYDHAFWSCNKNHENYADQEMVFQKTTIPLVDKAFAGYNACLFAYGQTGSGKSYSMMGIDNDDDIILPNSEAGIIPRFCHELFRRIDELKNSVVAEIEVSYFEIYNEKIHDLLAVTPSLLAGNQNTPMGNQAKRPALRVREHPTWGPYVVDLSTHPVDSHAALKNWIAVGNSQRATAATGMNEKSSRSHSIFNIILNLTEKDQHAMQAGRKLQTKRSKISLVDLAGSERVSHTCASGERLREGVSINKSLLTLGKVIAALEKSTSSFVPYRESVLTWLLRENLGGNSKTVMLATISPANLHLEETLATLRYACQARRIVNRVRVNEDPNDRQIRELRAEVERLQALQQDYERQKIHAVQAPPRKIIIETIDGTTADENEKETLRQQLRETEQELIKAQKSWRERLKEAEAMRKNEMKMLQQNGLALELSVAQKQPCLVNLATDPMLSGTLLYILPPGIVRIGRPKPSTCAQSDIVLDGPLVGENHCSIENKKFSLFIKPESEDFETYINGELLDCRRQIYHGDRVVIGGSHYFRISNPSCPFRNQNPVVDYHLAHQEILKEQEKRLRDELDAEKQAALQQIEYERSKNEGLYKEKFAKLEIEQFKFNCMKEIMESEQKALEKKTPLDSSFEYNPPQSSLCEQIERWHPEQSLHETQIKVKEATQRCRGLGLNYDFIQIQVADEFGLFKAMVNIIDRNRNQIAEWPTARLDVWLDWMRENDVTPANVFDCFDVIWTEREEDDDLNDSLNSSRISLNLSAMRGMSRSNSVRSSFTSICDRFMPWSDRSQNATVLDEISEIDGKTSSSKTTQVPTKQFATPKKPARRNGNKENINSTTTRQTDRTFEIEAQIELRNLRKATLKLKQLCNDNGHTTNPTVANDIKLAHATVTKIENLTNELRSIFKMDGDDVICKTPKSVRFVLD